MITIENSGCAIATQLADLEQRQCLPPSLNGSDADDLSRSPSGTIVAVARAIRCSRSRSAAVHPAPLLASHRRRLARLPAADPRSASRPFRQWRGLRVNSMGLSLISDSCCPIGVMLVRGGGRQAGGRSVGIIDLVHKLLDDDGPPCGLRRSRTTLIVRLRCPSIADNLFINPGLIFHSQSASAGRGEKHALTGENGHVIFLSHWRTGPAAAVADQVDRCARDAPGDMLSASGPGPHPIGNRQRS